MSISVNELNSSTLLPVHSSTLEKVAKDFESLLTTELLDEMKNSIGSWGFEKDGASEQLNGLFWMYLGRDIGQNGGIGLWKDIYRMLQGNESHNSAGQLLDDNL